MIQRPGFSTARACVILCALMAAPFARAATVGSLGSAYETAFGQDTLIDLVHPATSAGSFTNATVFWVSGAGNPCSAAFTLKFYRPDQSLTHLTFLDERGPFDAHDGLIDVTFSPPVALEAGDLIAVTELAPDTCGDVAIITAGPGEHTFAFFGDSGTSSISLCDTEGTFVPQTIGLIARTNGTEVRAGIVTGAGSVHGAAGLTAKTSMQLVNTGNASIQGRLVFHPIGHSASPADPSIPYALPAFGVTAFSDVVDALGAAGLGSIDVIADSSYVPLVLTRVFNDGGAAGTAGFTEPLVRPGDQYVLDPLHTAYLVVPSDLTKYRMNVGLRTLSEGADIVIGLVRGGHTLTSVEVNYPPDEFDQKAAQDFLPGFALQPNDVIAIQVAGGKAIVFGVTVDNTTNDGSFQLGNKLGF